MFHLYYQTIALKVREYDQEIPQSYFADKPMAPLGRATEHLHNYDIRKTIEAKLSALHSPTRRLQT